MIAGPEVKAPPPALPPVALSDREIRLLSKAARWARINAIIGFILIGLFLLMYPALIFTGNIGDLLSVPTIVMGATGLAAWSGAAVLVLAYAGNVRAFVAQGEPALTRALRRLRGFFKLWALTGAMEVGYEVATWLLKP